MHPTSPNGALLKSGANWSCSSIFLRQRLSIGHAERRNAQFRALHPSRGRAEYLPAPMLFPKVHRPEGYIFRPGKRQAGSASGSAVPQWRTPALAPRLRLCFEDAVPAIAVGSMRPVRICRALCKFGLGVPFRNPGVFHNQPLEFHSHAPVISPSVSSRLPTTKAAGRSCPYSGASGHKQNP